MIDEHKARTSQPRSILRELMRSHQHRNRSTHRLHTVSRPTYVFTHTHQTPSSSPWLLQKWPESHLTALHSGCQETGAGASAHKRSEGPGHQSPLNIFVVENSLLHFLNHFIHFQLQNTCNAPTCLQIPSKVTANLGKIIPVTLKYLIFAMQNSPRGHPGPQEWLIDSSPVLLAFTGTEHPLYFWPLTFAKMPHFTALCCICYTKLLYTKTNKNTCASNFHVKIVKTMKILGCKYSGGYSTSSSAWRCDDVTPTGAMMRLRHKDITPTGAMKALGPVDRHPTIRMTSLRFDDVNHNAPVWYNRAIRKNTAQLDCTLDNSKKSD
jgi:hypothetical protein